MFDDKTKEPEDIFGGDDPVSKPGSVMSPSAPNQALRPEPAMVTPEDVQTSAPSRTLIIVAVIVVVIVLALVAVLAGLWFARKNQGAVVIPTDNTTPLVPATNPLTTTPPVTQPEPTPTPVEPTPVVVDADKDGLTDAEEIELGTDVSKADTDADGLSDYEEVKVWHTNPLKADTDGDGFSDGTEVNAGYDPNVPGGKLLDINNPNAPVASAN